MATENVTGSSWGVSVVICCHNSSPRLPQTLAHLAVQQVEPALSWEVIVVDNASSDGTADAAVACWPDDAPAPLSIVAESQLGIGHARLCGLKHASFEILLFVDDDNWLAPNWIQTVDEIFQEHPEVAACGGCNEAVFEIEPPAWFERFKLRYAIGEQGDKEGDVTETRQRLWGAGIAIRKAAWQGLIGAGFSPLLVGTRGTRSAGGGEDSELCRALVLAGWRLWYSPRLRLQHYMPASRLDWNYLRGLARGNGRADIWLTLYKENQTPRRAAAEPLHRTKRLLRHRRRLLRPLVSPNQGDPTVLHVENDVAALWESIRNFRRYQAVAQEMPLAMWRSSSHIVSKAG